MDKNISYLWAKTDKKEKTRWQPLLLHMLDAAICAEAILDREPEVTRNRMAEILGMSWIDARPWLMLIIASHDLGKACPGFQCKWQNMTGLDSGRSPNTEINHAFVSQIVFEEWLCDKEWPDELAELVSDAIGCHHGERAKPNKIDLLAGDVRALGKGEWKQARFEILNALYTLFKPTQIPVKETLSGPDFMLLSGLTSFADWVGSNEEWFGFGTPDNCNDLSKWVTQSRIQAHKALKAIGWEIRRPLSDKLKSFKDIFNLSPRPLQETIEKELKEIQEPTILLVEAPMGEGKTEAAFYAHMELQRKLGHRGLYVALPTKATGNAMFGRTLEFLAKQGTGRKLDFQLLHGATLLNESFQNLRLNGIYEDKTGGEIRAGEWFTNKKRALLSEYGVGTIDQAILPILPVRHNFVRLWGLANRVVIFDEIHAYDEYTGTLLIHLMHWLLALGSSVILLSATLPPSIRKKIAEVVDVKFEENEVAYPRLSIFQEGEMRQVHFKADSKRRQKIELIKISSDLIEVQSALKDNLRNGGMGLALVNTVQRAQELYSLFPEGKSLEHEGQSVGKRLSDGMEIYLFHARFPADRRQKREENVLKIFGKGGNRKGCKILIATQVVEQSLDLDFDLIISDLAPIDLILQRAGRLWRHEQEYRPLIKPILIVSGLTENEPASFDKPLWWRSVYREDLLIRTWLLLHEKEYLVLPDEIDDLVKAVYEEQVEIPKSLQVRMKKAITEGDGDTITMHGQANQAIIGLPDDASWNDPSRFVLFDEDEPGVHRTLMAQTRLGGDSVIVIPLWENDQFNPELIPTTEKAIKCFLRAVSLSRKGVVRQIQAQGVPEGWKKSSLLRNCFPLMLNSDECWIIDETVRLDDKLGIIYKPKEAE